MSGGPDSKTAPLVRQQAMFAITAAFGTP
jgi:hypothetical protein